MKNLITKCLWEDCNQQFQTEQECYNHYSDAHIVTGVQKCKWNSRGRGFEPCNLNFQHKGHIRDHSVVHFSSIHPKQCTLCGERMKNRQNLHRHKTKLCKKINHFNTQKSETRTKSKVVRNTIPSNNFCVGESGTSLQNNPNLSPVLPTNMNLSPVLPANMTLSPPLLANLSGSPSSANLTLSPVTNMSSSLLSSIPPVINVPIPSTTNLSPIFPHKNNLSSYSTLSPVQQSAASMASRLSSISSFSPTHPSDMLQSLQEISPTPTSSNGKKFNLDELTAAKILLQDINGNVTNCPTRVTATATTTNPTNVNKPIVKSSTITDSYNKLQFQDREPLLWSPENELKNFRRYSNASSKNSTVLDYGSPKSVKSEDIILTEVNNTFSINPNENNLGQKNNSEYLDILNFIEELFS
ncbi:hypothetical protein HDU92_005680 [Lobulomyces angularis]|nr:hypothetical protein HDU92_005680 [Lobulomyces angularis]